MLMINWPLDIIFGQPPISYNVFLRNKYLPAASLHIVLSPKIKNILHGFCCKKKKQLHSQLGCNKFS